VNNRCQAPVIHCYTPTAPVRSGHGSQAPHRPSRRDPHVTARGNAKADIFLSAADASVFLATLGTVVREHGWSCFAYCLMPTHYHLLIETHAANLSVGMHSLNSAYARMFNAAHDRV